MQKKITIKTSILSLVILSILISSGLSTYFSYQGTKRSVRILVNHTLDEINNNFIVKMQNYLADATSTLKYIKESADNNLFHKQSAETISRLMEVILENNQQFASIYFGTPQGNFFMMKRMPDHTLSLKTLCRKDGETRTEWKHENPEWKTNYPNSIQQSDSSYDPRTREWYKKAIADKVISWTDAHIFYTSKKPGITCFGPIYQEDGTLDYVVGIDINLIDISYFLGSKIFEHSLAFILNQKDQIVAIPLRQEQREFSLAKKISDENDSYRLLHIEEHSNPILTENYRYFQTVLKQEREKPGIDNLVKFDISFNGKGYLAMNYSISDFTPWDWNISVLVPEDAFMAEVHRSIKHSLILSAILITLSLLLGVLISRSISKSLSLLAGEMGNIRKFELDSGRNVYSRIAEISDMSEALESMKTGLRSFKKYVPANLVRQLVRLGKDATLGGEKREMTIFFSDIAGFVSITEKLKPDELIKDFAEYLSLMSDTISHHHGTVDKYIGDAVMAFWGAPETLDDHAIWACKAALVNQRKVKKLSEKWVKSGRYPFITRMGINTGEVIIGNIGSKDRLNYTVIGDTVNLASRLEGINKFYCTDIIINESTYRVVKDHFETRMLDYVVVKGKKLPVAIYELISEKEDNNKEKSKFVTLFENGIALYRKKQWKEASNTFKESLKIKKDDKPSMMFIERCATYQSEPPPDDWTGVFVLKTK